MEESNLWAVLTVRELREHADKYARDGRDGLDPSEGFHPWDVVSTVTTLSEQL
jgi:hypothetical protein